MTRVTQHMSGGPVPVVTKEPGVAVDLVVDEQAIRHVPVMRFDMGDFPLTVSLSVEHAAAPWAGGLADEYRCVRLEEVRAVYYSGPAFPPAPSAWKSLTPDPEAARTFCHQVGGRVTCKPLMGGPLECPDGRRTGVPTHVVPPRKTVSPEGTPGRGHVPTGRRCERGTR